MTEMHCTAVHGDRATCTCGWRSPPLVFSFDDGAERFATWHRLSVESTIDNPLLTKFLAPVTPGELEVTMKIFGERTSFAEDFAHRERRDRLTAQYAWAIPIEPVLQRLADLSPICDLGCGTGYWADLLEKAGARKVLAVDSSPPLDAKNHYHRFERGVDIRHYVHVVRGDANTFNVPASHALMLCWPTYGTAMAANALKRYRGDRVIYIGEGFGGCTADDAFHNALEKCWKLTAHYDIPQWPGIHDSVRVYERIHK